jgi:hypothetical protein
MVVVTTRSSMPPVNIQLTGDEVERLLDQYDAKGSYDRPLNHGYCGDSACVTCGIVRRIREAVRPK